MLTKDLQDKEDLLVQTSKAFELLRDSYKENINHLMHTHDEEKQELLNRICKLENVSIFEKRLYAISDMDYIIANN